MNGYNDGAYIDFGYPSKSRTKTNSTTTFLLANKDISWSVFLQGVSFATGILFENNYGTLTSFDYAIEGTLYTIFDSGTATLMIPPMYYKAFIENIFTVASKLYG